MFPPVIIASNGRPDDAKAPSVGVVVIDGTTVGAVVAVIPPELCARWAAFKRPDGQDKKYHYIALVEQAAMVLGLVECSASFAGRDLIWLVDNMVVLADLAKGHNRTIELDAGDSSIQLMSAHLWTRCW